MKKATVTREALESPATQVPSILVGIDWADKEHAYCVRTPDGKLHTGSFQHSPKAIKEWIDGPSDSPFFQSTSVSSRHVAH